VALETRKTRAGRILFPPAPNICSAADIKTGFSAPTIYERIFIRNTGTGYKERKKLF
jgi:hypothetical protein